MLCSKNTQTEWDYFFYHLAKEVSTKSKDPSTKVGCVIVGPSHEVRTIGYNGFPRGVREHIEVPKDEKAQRELLKQSPDYQFLLDPERWDKRPEKYSWVEHAERNAIYNAARMGTSLEGCTAYLNWLPTPCADCTRAIIQAGIVRIVGPDIPFPGAGCGEHYHTATIEETMLKEAGVQRTILDPNPTGPLDQEYKLYTPPPKTAFELALDRNESEMTVVLEAGKRWKDQQDEQ